MWAAMSPRSSGGKASGVADAAADGVAGAGEGDPGGIQARVAGGVADQGADRLVAAEHGVDFLADHRRGPWGRRPPRPPPGPGTPPPAAGVHPPTPRPGPAPP